jgi:hypothetical protein
MSARSKNLTESPTNMDVQRNGIVKFPRSNKSLLQKSDLDDRTQFFKTDIGLDGIFG